MDKFILGSNVNRNGSPDFIIHLLPPIAIFAVHQAGDEVSSDKIIKEYTYRNPFGVEERFWLSVHHLFTTDFLSAPEAQAFPLMDKAWRWYRSYLTKADQDTIIDHGAQDN